MFEPVARTGQIGRLNYSNTDVMNSAQIDAASGCFQVAANMSNQTVAVGPNYA